MSRAVELTEQVLELVGGRAEAEVAASTGNLALTRFANSFIHQNVAEDGATVSLRVALDGRVASTQTTVTTPESLEAFVEAALDTAVLQPVDEDWPGLAPEAAVADVAHIDEATYDAAPAARASLVKDFVDAGDGLLAAGYCQTEGRMEAFANSAGQSASGRHSSAIIDGIHQTGTSAGCAHAASVAIGDLDGAAVGELAAKRAVDSAVPFDTKPGEYEVILAPEAVATIAVFLGFYGFNGKMLSEGQSFVDLGTRQFDEQFQMWDDVTDSRAMGVAFDTEGTPKGHLDLVVDGVTRGVAHNRKTAKKAGVASTGNNVPGAEGWGPIPTNVFVGGGDQSVDKLIASVERGIYVSTFNYCRILDPKTMVVTGLTRNGTFMIENGRITDAVTNLRFTQSFVDCFSEGKILGLGDDARFADSEFAPGIMYVPTMRLGSWNFTGGAEG
ncbi:MAG: metallopeptidase TldD-related protein [Acidimicrobiia bacterium]